MSPTLLPQPTTTTSPPLPLPPLPPLSAATNAATNAAATIHHRYQIYIRWGADGVHFVKPTKDEPVAGNMLKGKREVR